MKRLLAVSITLAMIFGLAVGASAFDTKRIDVPAGELQQVEESLGGLRAKDECRIYMDEYMFAGWISIWWASWFDSCCGFKKYVDPDEGYTTCVPPYFRFAISHLQFGMHTYFHPDTLVPVTVEWDIEEAMPSSHPCGFEPGPVIWTSGPLTYNLYGGFYGFIGVDFPCIWVDGPFFVSIHLLNHPNVGYFAYGHLTESTGGHGPWPTIPCWNWLYGACLGPTYAFWMEWVNDVGWVNSGNLYFWVDGRPAHNVAVDMGSFEAVPADGQVTLNWQSITETNNEKWVVKRDGAEIWTEAGQGNKETPTDYRYVDRNVAEGMTYSYTLEAYTFEGNVDIYGPVTATVSAVPHEFALSQNYPNPFNASTVIRYQLASDEHVSLKVYNINGQEVSSLVDTDQKAGSYSVHWTGKGVSSGVYFYTLTAGDFSQTKKMVFMK